MLLKTSKTVQDHKNVQLMEESKAKGKSEFGWTPPVRSDL